MRRVEQWAGNAHFQTELDFIQHEISVNGLPAGTRSVWTEEQSWGCLPWVGVSCRFSFSCLAFGELCCLYFMQWHGSMSDLWLARSFPETQMRHHPWLHPCSWQKPRVCSLCRTKLLLWEYLSCSRAWGIAGGDRFSCLVGLVPKAQVYKPEYKVSALIIPCVVCWGRRFREVCHPGHEELEFPPFSLLCMRWGMVLPLFESSSGLQVAEDLVWFKNCGFM